ncbi:MAG: hypothetical protein M1825_005903 [Sarcosagium campestre]|nr:MAG: hypothetical protein M1825_005903 [Sarcosagium campestre]
MLTRRGASTAFSLQKSVTTASPSLASAAVAAARLRHLNTSTLSSSSSLQQTRHASTVSKLVEKTTPPPNSATPDSLLAKQRLNRPVSPHLSIYQPQITWYLSILNRITGATLSGGAYVFFAAYLAAPLLGWHLESASLAAAVAAWPLAIKAGVKLAIALPFTFHSWNGIRHLVWDLGKEFGNKQVVHTGWVVVGLSVVSALALVAI